MFIFVWLNIMEVDSSKMKRERETERYSRRKLDYLTCINRNRNRNVKYKIFRLWNEA